MSDIYEDGYCVVCGNGNWKPHMPGCVIADLLDEIERLDRLRRRGSYDYWTMLGHEEENE